MRTAFKNFDGLLQAFHDTGLYESLDLLLLGGKGPDGSRRRSGLPAWASRIRVISLPSRLRRTAR